MKQITQTFPKRPELLVFFDDFVEFHDNCAFLCEAIASLVTEEDRFDTHTAMGIKRFCYWLKNRSEELNQDLRRALENTGTSI